MQCWLQYLLLVLFLTIHQTVTTYNIYNVMLIHNFMLIHNLIVRISNTQTTDCSKLPPNRKLLLQMPLGIFNNLNCDTEDFCLVGLEGRTYILSASTHKIPLFVLTCNYIRRKRCLIQNICSGASPSNFPRTNAGNKQHKQREERSKKHPDLIWKH